MHACVCFVFLVQQHVHTCFFGVLRTFSFFLLCNFHKIGTKKFVRPVSVCYCLYKHSINMKKTFEIRIQLIEKSLYSRFKYIDKNM